MFGTAHKLPLIIQRKHEGCSKEPPPPKKTKQNIKMFKRTQVSVPFTFMESWISYAVTHNHTTTNYRLAIS